MLYGKEWSKEMKPPGETLILSNERLVWSVVSRFSTVSERREDLFQAGMVGLMRAVDRFDFRRGTSFATFAVPHIFGEMSHLYRKLQNGGRRVSSEQINCAEREFIEKYGRSPKLDELAEELGCNPQDILQQHEIPMEEAEDVPDGRWKILFKQWKIAFSSTGFFEVYHCASVKLFTNDTTGKRPKRRWPRNWKLVRLA